MRYIKTIGTCRFGLGASEFVPDIKSDRLLAYNFLKQWEHRDKSFTYYDWMTRDFFEFLKNQKTDQTYWLAPGSSQYVWRKGPFEYKALQCYNISLEALKYEAASQTSSANKKWREIYGTKFPS